MSGWGGTDARLFRGRGAKKGRRYTSRNARVPAERLEPK